MTYTLLIITVEKSLFPYQPLERILRQMAPLHPCSGAARSAAVLLYLSLHRVVPGLSTVLTMSWWPQTAWSTRGNSKRVV